MTLQRSKHFQSASVCVEKCVEWYTVYTIQLLVLDLPPRYIIHSREFKPI